MTTPNPQTPGISLPVTPAQIEHDINAVQTTVASAVQNNPGLVKLVSVLANKAGYRTTEFYTHALGLALTWVTVFLSLSGQFQTAVPGKYQPWVVAAGTLATALQTGLYGLSRARVKAGAATTAPIVTQ